MPLISIQRAKHSHYHTTGRQRNTGLMVRLSLQLTGHTHLYLVARHTDQDMRNSKNDPTLLKHPVSKVIALYLHCNQVILVADMRKFTPSLKSLSKNLPFPCAEKRVTDCTNVEVGHVVFHTNDQTMERKYTKNNPPSPKTHSINKSHLTRSSMLATDADLPEYFSDGDCISDTDLPEYFSDVDCISDTDLPEYFSDVDCISDNDSYGIKVLHNPKSATIVDIVFLHGLTGNSFHTWFDRTSQTHWPRDLIKEDLPDARVMTFGYDADVVHAIRSASLESISSYSGDLLASLSGKRRGIEVSCN
jgi:hypothetical protein